MSPLGLYYRTIDVIDGFLSDVKHLNGIVCENTTVGKKTCGSNVMTQVRTRCSNSMCYTTLVRIKCEANMDFLNFILKHTKGLCIELYNRVDNDSDSDN